MKELFVPYDLTLKLKEIGFMSFSRFCFYIREDDTPYSKSLQRYDGAHHFISEYCIAAPTWQEAFDFLLGKLPDYLLSQCEDEIYLSRWSDDNNEWEVLNQSNRLKCLEYLIEVYEKLN